MTDKKNTMQVKKTIKLSGHGIYRCVGALEAVAEELLQCCRQNPGEAHFLRGFKLALSDLVEALTTLDKQMDLSENDPYCNSDFSYHEIVKIMAFANAAGIDIPTRIGEILAMRDLHFPLEFLTGVEALRFAHPSIDFELV